MTQKEKKSLLGAPGEVPKHALQIVIIACHGNALSGCRFLLRLDGAMGNVQF